MGECRRVLQLFRLLMQASQDVGEHDDAISGNAGLSASWRWVVLDLLRDSGPRADEGWRNPGCAVQGHGARQAIPGSKARDVVKVAVLPLGASSSDVSVEMTIRADGGLAGISRETLNLVVLEGLRQLGLTEVEVDAETGQ
jgi:hypothetical protein